MSALLLIRADASAAIGTGHVMRCLALAQAWRRRGGRVVFAHVETTPSLERRLQSEGMERVAHSAVRGSAADAAWTIELARSFGAAWVVADGYAFDASWQKQLRDAGQRLLAIDDYGQAEHYAADLVLNQNAGADAALYARRDPATRLLLGTRFTLLRQEFLAARLAPRVIPSVARKILVTLGGSDPDNVTTKVIEALAPLSDIEAVIVVGGGNPNLSAVRQAVETAGAALRLVVNATNMAELMEWADVAISAAGSTSWELAYMRLPALLIVVADNQQIVGASLDRAGVCLSLGGHAVLTAENIFRELRAVLADGARRQEMSREGGRLIDGDGADRVATRLLATQVRLRCATPDDCALLWQWVNDPAVRSASFHQEAIPWETHRHWFQTKLNGSTCAIFVGLDVDGRPVGQVRFEWDETAVAEIDVSVDRLHRLTGIGPALIRRAVDELFATTPVVMVHARIKTANSASIRAFGKAGFTRVGSATVDGYETACLTIAAEDVHFSAGQPARDFAFC